MTRSLPALIASAILGGTFLTACGSPSHRAEGRMVLTTVSPGAVGGSSSDVAIGGDVPPGSADDESATASARFIDVSPAPPALDIASRNGSISVVVDPNATGMTIVADLTSRGWTMDEAEARLAEMSVDVTESPDGTVRIRPVMPGGWKNGDGAHFQISLPESATVIADSSNGAMRIEGCHGPIDLETSNGRLTLIGTAGEVSAETSNGAIVIRDTEGDITAVSSNGRVVVEDHLGALSVRTSNGSMDIELHDESDAPLVARTSNGSVDVSVGSAFGGWLQASTSNGRVKLEGDADIDGPVEIEKRSMKVKLKGDDDDSRIRSSNGNVRVVVRG